MLPSRNISVILRLETYIRGCKQLKLILKKIILIEKDWNGDVVGGSVRSCPQAPVMYMYKL